MLDPHSNFPTGGIITNGLGLPACMGMITTHFSLLCFDVVVVAPPTKAPFVGGGSIPLRPGQIQGLFKPVIPSEKPFLTPYDYDPLRVKKTHVTVRVSLKGKVIEKEYLVTPKRSDAIVYTINIFNKTKNKITASITNIKRIVSKGIVKIKNIRTKR